MVTNKQSDRPADYDLPLRPILLLADSQMLFWKSSGGATLLRSVVEKLDKPELRAAYIGVANDDQKPFYELFEAAVREAGIARWDFIRSRFSVVDEVALNNADVIVLGGGDPVKGWDVIVRRGMKETIVNRYLAGALLVGVSAGAMLLGQAAWRANETAATQLVKPFSLVPFVIAVHDSSHEWSELREVVSALGENTCGIGIPGGGGLIYHPDHSIEVLRYPATELCYRDGGLKESVLLPAGTH